MRLKDDYLVKMVYFPNQYQRNCVENSVGTMKNMIMNMRTWWFKAQWVKCRSKIKSKR